MNVYVETRSFGRGVAIHIELPNTPRSETVMRAKPIEFVPELVDSYTADPALEMHRDDAQNLMDQLWSAGLRPTEGAGSAGSLAATTRHLEDMRRLVFDAKTTG